MCSAQPILMSQLGISPVSPGGKQRQSPCSLSQAGSLAHFITLQVCSGGSSKDVHQGHSSALGSKFQINAWKSHKSWQELLKASFYCALSFVCVLKTMDVVICWQKQALLPSVLQNQYCCRRAGWVPPQLLHTSPPAQALSPHTVPCGS